MSQISRRHKRHVFDPPVAGNYGPFRVVATNISVSGLQVEHVSPLKLQTMSRMSFPLPRTTATAELNGEVLWSHLSRKPNHEGKYLYRSGIRLAETSENMSEVARLVQAWAARDEGGSSTDRRAREIAAATVPVMRKIHTAAAVDPDRILLIQQTAQRLKQNPEELSLHASRGRSALSIRIASVVQTDEVLAVWEYLQRLVPLEEVERVLSPRP